MARSGRAASPDAGRPGAGKRPGTRAAGPLWPEGHIRERLMGAALGLFTQRGYAATTVREMFEVLGAVEALAGELACRNASDADIAEIRALHYEMLAHHARGELDR